MAVKKAASEALVSKEKTATKASADFFLTVAAEVENLSEKSAFALIPQLVEEGGQSDFRLGGALALIQTKGWFGEAESFEDLCDKQFKLHPRKARYLISIYTNLVDKQIPYAVVKGVSWTKLRELAPILTPKNAESWAKKAEKMTVVQLLDAIKKAKAKAKGGDADPDGEDAGSQTVSVVTFKLHTDQKEIVKEALGKMKGESGTEHDTVALANICTGYVGGTIKAVTGVAAKPKTKKKQVEKLAAELKLYGAKVLFEAFDIAFPNIEITVSKWPDGAGEPVEVGSEEAEEAAA